MRTQARKSSTTSNGRSYRALRPTRHCKGSCRKRRHCKPFTAMWSGWRERATNSLPPCCTYRGFTALFPAIFVKIHPERFFGPRRRAFWPPKELQTGNGVWRVDMVKCPYHDTCIEYGWPRSCAAAFCDSDDISYTGLHPKLIWERSMTLGRGNDRCDFLHEGQIIVGGILKWKSNDSVHGISGILSCFV